jgi:hypothetical protein
MTKFMYLLRGRPAIVPKPTNRLIRPIPGSMRRFSQRRRRFLEYAAGFGSSFDWRKGKSHASSVLLTGREEIRSLSVVGQATLF